MRFLPQMWAVASGLCWIKHLPIIQHFYLWIKLSDSSHQEKREKKTNLKEMW